MQSFPFFDNSHLAPPLGQSQHNSTQSNRHTAAQLCSQGDKQGLWENELKFCNGVASSNHTIASSLRYVIVIAESVMRRVLFGGLCQHVRPDPLEGHERSLWVSVEAASWAGFMLPCRTVKSAAGRWQHPLIHWPSRPRWQSNYGWKNSLDIVPRWMDNGKERCTKEKRQKMEVEKLLWIHRSGLSCCQFQRKNHKHNYGRNWKLSTVKSWEIASNQCN